MAEEKVQFNLHSVYYAKLTTTISSGVESYSYGTPVAIPGAVTLTLSQEGSIESFYADGIVYYQTVSNNGYSGSLEVARVPDQMLQDIWGVTLHTTDKTLQETANVQPSPFALLYAIDNDISDNLYVLYNVKANRPNIGSTTNTETKTPQTQTMDISAPPRGDHKVMCRTTADSPSTVRAGWFATVYEQS